MVLFEAGIYLAGSYSIILSIGLVVAIARTSRNSLRALLYTLLVPAAFVGIMGMFFMLALVSVTYIRFMEYTLYTYLLLLILLSILIIRYMLVRPKLLWRSSGGILLILLPLLPYIMVEAQTQLFGPSLVTSTKKALVETHWVEPIHVCDIKVLKITPRSAVVYVVTGNGKEKRELSYTGDVVELVRTVKGWKYKQDSWGTVWSDTGSAHGITFPTYLGKGDYR